MKPKVELGQDNLKCILKDSELLEYGRQQARALSDIDRAEDELKTFTTSIKNRIAVCEATIKAISEKIRNGYEFRFVSISIMTDYDAGLVTFRRADTDEIFSQRPLNAEERQFVLDFKADVGGPVDKTEEHPGGEDLPAPSAEAKVEKPEARVIFVNELFLDTQVKPSYSGASIAHKVSVVAKPFKYDDKRWVCTGSEADAKGDHCNCYQLVPRAEYTGEIRTYSLPEGRQYEEYYESLRNDPTGFYNGMAVKWGKKDCVLVGPEVTFTAGEQ